MSKKTLICIHIMPSEIEMFQRFMQQYRKALSYCGEYDVTIKATLNLNPQLTDWEKSELKQDYFMELFTNEFAYKGLKNINQIILDDSFWGTTQQKRESIKIDYFDQFIFVDTDIAIHELQLAYQLKAAENLNGMYIVSPSIPKWWDASWDFIVHRDFQNSEYGEAFKKEVFDSVYTQNVSSIELRKLPTIKFGCGMHTLYSKEYWNFVGIPEEFGGYGPEDTFGMFAAIYARQKGYDINQYVLDGIYIAEDYSNREPTIKDKLVTINKKDEFYSKAESLGRELLISFVNKI